jgi:DNA repair exonuclease SbcCD nuclease subunit
MNNLILTSDWHLRETKPICRLDNFVDETQWKKVDFISELQKKLNCPVLHAGDLYDYWKPSPELLSKTIQHLPDQFYTVYGNHDLPQHSLKLKKKCGIYTLESGGLLQTKSFAFPEPIEMCSFGQIPNLDYKILVWHKFAYQGKIPWPGCTESTGHKLLIENPKYNLIITGDNHKPFVEEYEGRLLVNPGSIFRMNVDQIDHKPRVYIWNSEINNVEPVYIPIKQNIISREHLEFKEQRDSRLDSFVSSLSTNWETSISFEQNLDVFKKTNNIKDPIMDIIYKAVE